MTKLIHRRSFLQTAGAAGATLSLTAAGMPAFADGHSATVEMLNQHPENRRLRQVFFPRVIAVEPGETVLFAATDRGHNSAALEGMVPDGVELWDGDIGSDIAVTFEKPGFYGYKCTPHASVGMVGLVVVKGDGMMDNLEAAQGVRQRGKAKQVWEEIWEEAAAEGLMG